jgi:hypothetical protein
MEGVQVMRQSGSGDAQLLMDLARDHPGRVRGEQPTQDLEPHLVSQGGEAAGEAGFGLHVSTLPER